MNTDLTKVKDETELLLVGCMIHKPEIIGNAVERVEASDFHSRQASKVFSTVVKVWSDGLDVTPANVAELLPENLADYPYIWEGMVGSVASAPFYCERIKEASTRRKLEKAGRDIQRMAKEDDREVAEVVGSAQDKVSLITVKDDRPSLGEDANNILIEAQDAAQNRYGISGAPTPFQTLNEMTDGLGKQNYWVIGARPSMGKSAIGVNIAQHLLEETNCYNCAFFSAEMSQKSILMRMAAARTGIDSNRIRRGDLSKGEWSALTDSVHAIASDCEGRLFIDDRARPTPGYISSRVKQITSKHELHVVFVDYLQALGYPGKPESEVVKLNNISADLDAMKKQYNLAVVAMAQVGRTNEGKRTPPSLSELKGSGNIEQDADVVVFVHRETRESQWAELLVAKQRNGPVGKFRVMYDGPTTKFTEGGR